MGVISAVNFIQGRYVPLELVANVHFVASNFATGTSAMSH